MTAEHNDFQDEESQDELPETVFGVPITYTENRDYGLKIGDIVELEVWTDTICKVPKVDAFVGVLKRTDNNHIEVLRFDNARTVSVDIKFLKSVNGRDVVLY